MVALYWLLNFLFTYLHAAAAVREACQHQTAPGRGKGAPGHTGHALVHKRRLADAAGTRREWNTHAKASQRRSGTALASTPAARAQHSNHRGDTPGAGRTLGHPGTYPLSPRMMTFKSVRFLCELIFAVLAPHWGGSGPAVPRSLRQRGCDAGSESGWVCVALTALATGSKLRPLTWRESNAVVPPCV